MKIGFVLDDSLDKTDGVQQYILTAGRWLTDAGHEVHYLVGNTQRTDIAHIHSLSKNLQVHFNENRMSTPLPTNKSKLLKLLQSENFDILHVQMPYSPFLAGRIIRLASPQTVVIGTFHIVPFSLTENVGLHFLRLMTTRSRRRFDKSFSVSPPAAKFAKHGLHLKTQVLPNAIDHSLFSRGRRLAEYDDGKINIVFLGRLVERKGCLLLLKAIERLHKAKLLRHVRVLVCGKGPLRPRLEKYVRDNRLGAVVHFIGFVSEANKRDYLASADIAVFPSTGGESFGIVLIEAMVAGSGVVLAGNNAGYRWVMKNNKDQLLDPKNTAVFAKRLQHFILNSKARAKAKRWQTIHAKEFDIQIIGPILVNHYQQAIAKKSRT